MEGRFIIFLILLWNGSLCADTVRVERIEGEQHRVISSGEDFRKINPEPNLEAEFDSNMATNVTSPAGKTAYLTCRVKNLGNRTVNEYFNNVTLPASSKGLHPLQFGLRKSFPDLVFPGVCHLAAVVCFLVQALNFVGTFPGFVPKTVNVIPSRYLRPPQNGDNNDVDRIPQNYPQCPRIYYNISRNATRSPRLKLLTNELYHTQVSWVRHRDIHILTTGTYTYTSDQRFQAIHRPDVYPESASQEEKSWSEWTLCIKWVQERDSGIYECQLSTAPVTSHPFRLNIVVPTARILSGSELFVDAGSTLNLTCVVGVSPEPPEYIFWYYNEKMLNYDSPSSRKFVYTEKGNDFTTSVLVIKSTDQEDSGEYSCRPSNAKKASVRVHVLNGERPEAMQTGGATIPVLSLLLIILSSSSNGFS